MKPGKCCSLPAKYRAWREKGEEMRTEKERGGEKKRKKKNDGEFSTLRAH